MSKHLTSEQVNNIPSLKAEGKSNKQIAELYGVSTIAVQVWVQKLREAGHNIPRDKRSSIVITPPHHRSHSQ